MPGPAVLDTLIATENLAADEALLAALAEGDPAEAEPIVDALLRRAKPRGLAGLLTWFHKLPRESQRRVIAAADELYGPLRDASGGPEPQTRLNVIAVIGSARRYRLSYLLAALLRDPTPRVREYAALTLRKLTEALLSQEAALQTRPQVVRTDPAMLKVLAADVRTRAEDRRQLADSLAAGLEAFKAHHHPPVVEAAMWMVDDLGDRLWSALDAKNNQVRRTASDLLLRSFSVRLVPFTIESLAHSEFRTAAAKLLSGNLNDAALAALLANTWRLAAPSVRRSMAMIKHMPALAAAFGRRDALAAWNEIDQVHAVRWVIATGVPTNQPVDFLETLVTYGMPLAQRAAVWALCDIYDPAATDLLGSIVRRRDRALAAIARRALRRRSHAHRTETDLATDAPTDVAPPAIEEYWNAFDELSPVEQAIRGSELLGPPDALEAFADTKLQSPRPSTRVKALQILTTAGVVADAADAVYRLAHDPAPTVRSAAMAALGQIDSQTSARLLRNGMNDGDSRVRANAVEAIDRLSLAAGEQLTHEKLHDENNRTRANAAKALLKAGVRDAAVTLCEMLQHPAPEQRISALWVVGQMHLGHLLHRITEMAQRDPDERVRTRARVALERSGPQAGTAESTPSPTIEEASSSS